MGVFIPDRPNGQENQHDTAEQPQLESSGFDPGWRRVLQLGFARLVPQRQCGPVAQLGARMNGIHEVTGSIPVWSTILRS